MKKENYDVCARILSMGKAHHAFTGTGSIAAAAAACVKGSIMAWGRGSELKGNEFLKLGHPAGTLDVGAKVDFING